MESLIFLFGKLKPVIDGLFEFNQSIFHSGVFVVFVVSITEFLILLLICVVLTKGEEEIVEEFKLFFSFLTGRKLKRKSTNAALV
jgi:hypothetical protein